MSKRKPQFDFWTIVTIGILAVFALFLIYPLISLFVDGFLEEGTGAFTMANFTKFFGKKFYYRSLLNSLKLTVCVTICSLLIGVPHQKAGPAGEGAGPDGGGHHRPRGDVRRHRLLPGL